MPEGTATFRLVVSELGPFPAAVTPAIKLTGFVDSASDLGSVALSGRAEPLEGETTLDIPLDLLEFSLPLGSPSSSTGSIGDGTPTAAGVTPLLVDRLCSKRLYVQIVDTATDNQQLLTGDGICIDLRPFLHEKTRISIDKKEVSLAEEVEALWTQPASDPTESEPERTREKVRKPTVISLALESLVTQASGNTDGGTSASGQETGVEEGAATETPPPIPSTIAPATTRSKNLSKYSVFIHR